MFTFRSKLLLLRRQCLSFLPKLKFLIFKQVLKPHKELFQQLWKGNILALLKELKQTLLVLVVRVLNEVLTNLGENVSAGRNVGSRLVYQRILLHCDLPVLTCYLCILFLQLFLTRRESRLRLDFILILSVQRSSDLHRINLPKL